MHQQYDLKSWCEKLLIQHHMSVQDACMPKKNCHDMPRIGSALAPRSTMVHASPSATPEKWTSLSSPIMISSITLHRPSFTASGVSNVDAISPPAPARRCGLQLELSCVPLGSCPAGGGDLGPQIMEQMS